MKKNFLISTGGSGGHVIPATVLYEHLVNDNHVIISTDRRGLKFLNKDHYELEIIDTPKLNNIFLLPFKLIIIFFLTLKSLHFYKSRKIKKIFSTGGYMSLPLILAAKFLKLDIYLLEPNHVLGRANKFFLNSCKKIFCYNSNIKNFPNKFKDKIVSIYPLIKKQIYELEPNKKNKGKFTLLIVGGSQGAEIFDKNLKEIIINISKKFKIKIIQQTNKKNISNLNEFYSINNVENKIFNFEKNFENIINEADICITRGGASTLAELSVLNVPFIVVPLPTSKDYHQLENANFYKNNDCCWIIEQDYFDKEIEQLLKDIIVKKSSFLKKKENLKKLNYKNTWINVNQKILENIDEN